ncbi:AAA family ATPase [Sphingomonas jeddahensis]|uniref:DNA polymerase III subunit tau n=1 Tax=Sphingomonas jeddahensis TaxID=1915074 RepID=A0A1V2EYJ1_9SPHN|nr:AAA family ATPase [Sphingomonas jeddahensis]ONF97583.1 DNA polymerase III subunit tau [Sphingomonas jeddahensis]
MTTLRGNAPAARAFQAAAAGGIMHHAWLLAGPQGVGKASFAREAAIDMLARATGELGPDRTRALVDAGSHPDYRVLDRLPKDGKPDADLARSITIAQVRSLQPLFATTPSLGPRRVVLIDAVDDLERAGANALLKNLEEPPAGTIFLLISHAPGRLLPTIRSRCRLLRFEPLTGEDMLAALSDLLPESSGDEREALVRAGAGSPGRALRFAGLDLDKIDAALGQIARHGDRDNTERVRLMRALSLKAAQPRYEAFLDRVPTFIAEQAPYRNGPALRTALDAYDQARSIAASARALSLDAGGTVFELAGVVARLAR